MPRPRKTEVESSVNGFEGQKVVEFVMDSGELVHVKPLSIYVLQSLTDKATQHYPYPEKALYIERLSDELAAVPGTTIPAEQNPEYQRLCREVNRERLRWLADYIVMTACTFPAGQRALIRKYADDVTRWRSLVDVPDDPWEATLKFCLIGSEQDRLNILNAARGNLELTEAEVRDGLRIFRPVLRSDGRSDTIGEPIAPGVETTKPLPS